MVPALIRNFALKTFFTTAAAPHRDTVKKKLKDQKEI